jgi:high-affinity iron transporter
MSVFLILFPASVAFADQETEKLVVLLDYLDSDYKNAVQDGNVVSQHEYQKMQDFAKRTLEIINRLKEIDKGDKAGIKSGINSLVHEIENKAEAKTVVELATSTKEKLITTYGIVTYPKRLPSLAKGKTIYLENCAQCHGESGKGDGPSRPTIKSAGAGFFGFIVARTLLRESSELYAKGEKEKAYQKPISSI